MQVTHGKQSLYIGHVPCMCEHQTCCLASTQEVCEGLRVEGEEQIALQQQLEQQQAQLAAADEQHAAAEAQLTSLRLTALDGSSNKLLEQVCTPVQRRGVSSLYNG